MTGKRSSSARSVTTTMRAPADAVAGEDSRNVCQAESKAAWPPGYIATISRRDMLE